MRFSVLFGYLSHSCNFERIRRNPFVKIYEAYGFVYIYLEMVLYVWFVLFIRININKKIYTPRVQWAFTGDVWQIFGVWSRLWKCSPNFSNFNSLSL